MSLWLRLNVLIIFGFGGLLLSTFGVGRVLPYRGALVYEDYSAESTLHLYMVDVGRKLRFSPTRGLIDNAAQPAPSPDGKHLAFTSTPCDSCGNHVYLLDMQSRQLRQLTQVNGSVNQNLSWSPDSRHLLLTGALDKTLPDPGGVYLVDVQSGAFHRLPYENIHNESSPAWSPDGRQIVFKGSLPWDAMQTFVINRDGSNLRSHELMVNSWSTQLHWSPEGDRLALDSFDKGIYIFHISADAITSEPLSSFGWSPVWSPNGEMIAFASDETAAFRGNQYGGVYLVNSDGLNLRPVGRQNFEWIAQLSWSPDSEMLAFIARCNADHLCIYVLQVATGQVAPLAHYQRWRRPDEARLAWWP
jgi:Tol biopolymer transport system component